MGWKDDLIKALYARYRRAPRHEKNRILDEFCAATGYHRKYAIQVLRRPRRPRPPRRRGRPMLYAPEVDRLLAMIWRAAGAPGARRLKRELAKWLPWARERFGLKPAAGRQLLAMSARTIDRRLRPFRERLARWPEDLRGRALPSVPGPPGGIERRRYPRPPTPGTAAPGPPLSPAEPYAKMPRAHSTHGAAPPATPGEGLMETEITTRKQKDVLIVSIKGALVMQKDGFQVMKVVMKELKEFKKFVIDLGKVDKIDSAGVGELVAINVAVKEKGGQLRLSNLEDRVGKVLQMALIHKIIPTFDTQKEAVESFAD
jgi:anti-anti-sigma factor